MTSLLLDQREALNIPSGRQTLISRPMKKKQYELTQGDIMMLKGALYWAIDALDSTIENCPLTHPNRGKLERRLRRYCDLRNRIHSK